MLSYIRSSVYPYFAAAVQGRMLLDDLQCLIGPDGEGNYMPFQGTSRPAFCEFDSCICSDDAGYDEVVKKWQEKDTIDENEIVQEEV